MQRQRLVQRLAKAMTRYGAGFRELEKETTDVIAGLECMATNRQYLLGPLLADRLTLILIILGSRLGSSSNRLLLLGPAIPQKLRYVRSESYG
jgi:hypothetical protein